MKQPVRRCALYTRKSSQEGLDQAFNSLDAQREACAAYVASQKAEGWKALPTIYDDGGFSGGSMKRPALQRLLSAVAAGLIDVIVVYKIDRLTRALADFARMVELFDAHDVSFVSVTQSFNTTTSMGRLTLHVLLSFAQFERDVTGERIRDKIAASKAKGMWMGGNLPLGYDLPVTDTRTLQVNLKEAETVRLIFGQYLKLASVHALQRWLNDRDIRSKRRVTKKGRVMGGLPFSRGALFHLLKNRIYLGEIVHRGNACPGLHEAIIDNTLFTLVQNSLLRNSHRRKTTREKVARSSLVGRIFDAAGHPMTPTFSYGARGTLYRYYVSAPLQQGVSSLQNQNLRRVSAAKLEARVRRHLNTIMNNTGSTDLLESIIRLIVGPDDVQVLVPLSKAAYHNRPAENGVTIEPDTIHTDQLRVTLPIAFGKKGRHATINSVTRGPTARDENLIRALKRANSMLSLDHLGMPVIDASPVTPHNRRLIRLAFLAPELQCDILLGKQPRKMTLAKLLKNPLPPLWQAQLEMFRQ